MHLSLGNACFQFLMSSDVKHRTVYVVSWFFAFKHGESEFSKKDVTVYMS